MHTVEAALTRVYARREGPTFDVEASSRCAARKGVVLAAGLGCLALLFGTLSSATPAGAARAASPAYPSSIAVIGHSFATGEGVSGPRAFRVRSSWVTGDTAAVQSVYSRILARNPAIRGNKFNLARGGADVQSMLLQARKAITIKPAPELVVVQGIDHDITCNETGHRPFQVAFARVLGVLATGLPDARIFVVSQFGSVPTYIKALTLKQRINQRLRISAGSGPCAFLDARGAPSRRAWRTSKP